MSFILFEVKRKETEEYLKRLYEQGGGDRYIISFSFINKYGINPRPFDPKTPLGVYGYLLKFFFETYSSKIDILPYGANFPYILVLKIKPDAKILVVSKITSSDVKRLFQYLSNYVDESLRYEMEKVLLDKDVKPFQQFFRLLSYTPTIFKTKRRYVSLRNILTDLGYDIIIDDGMSAIHPHEPHQVVVLNLSKAEHVKTLYNPYAGNKPKDETDFRYVYHKFESPRNSFNPFIFTVLKNKLNLNDKNTQDKLILFLKKHNPSITTEVYEQFLSEIKPIIKKIYDQYDERNYNPIEAVFKYLPTFEDDLRDISKKYNLGFFSLLDIQRMMTAYLTERDWKKYIDLFPVNIKNIPYSFVFDFIFFSIRFKLDEQTIKKLATILYENYKILVNVRTADSYYLFKSVAVTILKLSQNPAHHDLANSIIEEIIEENAFFPSLSIEMTDNIINICQSKPITVEKIANIVDAFTFSFELKNLKSEIEREYRRNDSSDKKQQLQMIVNKVKEFVDKKTGNLFSQDEKNLLIKIAAKHFWMNIERTLSNI